MVKPVVDAVFVLVELGEHKVPKFHIPVAVTADRTVGTAAAVFLAAVKVYLGAGSAGACAYLPEVILLAEVDDSVLGDSDLLRPNLYRLFVLFIDADPKTILGDFENLCDKLPRPGGCLMLEVVAEGEVSEHFEEGAVS